MDNAKIAKIKCLENTHYTIRHVETDISQTFTRDWTVLQIVTHFKNLVSFETTLYALLMIFNSSLF